MWLECTNPSGATVFSQSRKWPFIRGINNVVQSEVDLREQALIPVVLL